MAAGRRVEARGKAKTKTEPAALGTAPPTNELETIDSFIGSEIADPTSPDAERAPRSAKHVVTLEWSWSPAHERWAEYRLATDRRRVTWNLYEFCSDFDTGRRICARIATGTPYRGVSPKRAALALLAAAWRGEKQLFDFDPAGARVLAAGLLGQDDIDVLVDDISAV